jgi:acetyl esterase
VPLAPECRAVLDWIAANRPPYHTVPVVEARRLYREARRSVQPDPPEVGSVEDRRIPGPAGEIPLRSYRPLGAGAREVLPALVYFHGGGWTIGDLDTHDTLCRSLASEARCGVISVDYRLAPEHKFPAAADDAVSATRWIAENAGTLGIDPGRLAVGGDSSGGNLAAVVALTARDAGGPCIAFQLLIYPSTKIDADFPSIAANGTGYALTRELMAWFRSNYVRGPDDRRDWRTSPLLAPDLSCLPPALVLTAEYDPLRDEGQAYADRMRDAGVDAAHLSCPGMIHGFILMGKVIPAANEAIRGCARALAAALRTG